MVFETDIYARRTRPTLSSYSVTTFPSHYYYPYSYLSRPYYSRPYYFDRYGGHYISSYNYYSPLRVFPTYSRVGSYLSRPSFRFGYDYDYVSTPYSKYASVVPIPLTRITTSPRFVYRDTYSPTRTETTTTTRIYRRDVNSPVRVITSPARIMNYSVRPSVLAKEFDRIDRRYRAKSVFDERTHDLKSEYSLAFNDATRQIRNSTNRLLKEIHEPLPRAMSVPRAFLRAGSLQPSGYYDSLSRYSESSDKWAQHALENEVYVNQNILRPTRKTRDHIEVLSNLYREQSKPRFSVGLYNKFNKLSTVEENKTTAATA
jgi:hypothetical protein